MNYTLGISIRIGFGMSLSGRKIGKMFLNISTEKKEMIYVIALTLLCTILSFSFEVEFVETIYAYSRSHEDWELDEFIFSFFWLAIFSVIYSIRRVNDLKKLSEKNEHNSKHDHLTGLPNRKYALDYLSRALSKAKKHNTSVAIIYMDLNNFKQINDFYGHHYGDQFINEVSKRLSSTIRNEELISRIGGDEFLLISEFSDNDISTIPIIDRIKSSQRENYLVEGKYTKASFSIGVAFYPKDGDSVESLIVASDSAMYHAKQNKSDSECYYTEDIGRTNNQRIKLAKHLKDALFNDELHLVYQPIVDIMSGKVLGYEALTRWKLDGAMINPELIVSIADKSGLAENFFIWLIETSSKNGKLFLRNDQFISINVSAVQFLNDHFLQNVKEKLVFQTSINVEFEITESSLLLDHDKTCRTISGLHELGVKVMIDDFGKGYSSLGRLNELDVDKLKVDKSFIQDATKDSKSLGIFESIIELANKLELKVVIEGIETKEQLQLLQRNSTLLGKDLLGRELLGQGYLFEVPTTRNNLRPESDIIEIVTNKYLQ